MPAGRGSVPGRQKVVRVSAYSANWWLRRSQVPPSPAPRPKSHALLPDSGLVEARLLDPPAIGAALPSVRRLRIARIAASGSADRCSRHRWRQIRCCPLTKPITISAPNCAFCTNTSKASLPVAQTARVPLAEPAHVLHGGLSRPVNLVLLLRVGRQQKNKDDEPKTVRIRNISVPLFNIAGGGPASSLPTGGGTIASRR